MSNGVPFCRCDPGGVDRIHAISVLWFSVSVMPQPYPKPIPRYLLPNEVKVFWTLLRLRPIGNYGFQLPIRKLAEESRLSYTATHQAVKALALKGYLRYAPGRIIYLPSRFRLLCTYDPRYPRPTS